MEAALAISAAPNAHLQAALAHAHVLVDVMTAAAPQVVWNAVPTVAAGRATQPENLLLKPEAPLQAPLASAESTQAH